MKNLLKVTGLFLWQLSLVFAQRQLPDSIDWRDSLTSVRRIDDQKSCGSCYAFSALDSLEAAYEIKGKKVDLSEQQIIDCTDMGSADVGYGNFGCQGGWMHNTFEFIQDKGIDSEKNYRYRGVQLDSCLTKEKHLCKPIVSYVNLTSEAEIKRAVAELGPVSVVIDAVHPAFFRYTNGIYDNPDCTSSTNHAVTVVGYGTENDTDYWIVKNSWGKVWGDKGFVKIIRGKNMCGIGNIGSIPILKCRLCVPSCKKDKH